MIDRLTAGVFRALSAARGARVFHPDGVAFRARFEPAAAVPVLGGSRLLRDPSDAVVRLSRGIGLPRGLPDVLGVAVKVLDVYGPGQDQDLALASTGRSWIGRRLLRPGRDLAAAVFSSLLPYAVDGRRAVVMAAFAGSVTPMPLARLADVARVDADVRVWLEPGDVTLGWVRLGERLPPAAGRDLRFDPWHTGPGLRPVGLLNRLRRPAYAASQEGRGAPAAGVRAHLAADRPPDR